MPAWERQKVMNTLMAYRTIRSVTEPRLTSMSTRAAPPIRRIPFLITSRSLRRLNWLGSHLSRDMLDSTRGPSRKPVWAATNRSTASEMRATRTNDEPGHAPSRGDALHEHGVQRLPGDLRDAEEEVADHEAHRHEGQGGGHVPHRALGGLHARLAEDGKAVAHRLDAGVGARTHAVGPHDEDEDAERPELRGGGPRVMHRALHHGADLGRVHAQGEEDGEGMGDQEQEEDGHQGADGFLDAPQVQERQDQDTGNGEQDLHAAAGTAGGS